MSKDILQADPILQLFYGRFKTWYEGKFPGFTVVIGDVDRTPAGQLLKFCQDRLPQNAIDALVAAGIMEKNAGRVTEKDGYNDLSKHNYKPSHAIDIWIKDGTGRVLWSEEYYKPIGQAIFELGFTTELRWGGSWGDCYHVELRKL